MYVKRCTNIPGKSCFTWLDESIAILSTLFLKKRILSKIISQGFIMSSLFASWSISTNPLNF